MARAFDGTGQRLALTDPTGLDLTGKWSFCFPIKFTDFSSDGRCFFHAGIPGDRTTRGVFFYTSGGGVPRYQLGGGTGNIANTALDADTWYKLGFVRDSDAGAGHINVIIDGASDSNYNEDPPAALEAGDVARFSDSDGDLGVVEFKGEMDWPWVLVGVALTPTELDAYALDPCQLITDYGPGGAIVADALVWLLPFQPGTPGEDIGGKGNNFTNSGTTDVGSDPFSLPTSCEAPSGGDVKTMSGVAQASIKTVLGITAANVKTISGLTL